MCSMKLIPQRESAVLLKISQSRTVSKVFTALLPLNKSK